MGALVLGFFDVLKQAEGGIGFRGEDLVFCCMGEAEFADGEAGFEVGGVVADGWPEGAAENGAGGVEVAGLGGGVEDGTRVGVSPLFEEFDGLVVVGEDARFRIAGEEGEQVVAGLLDADFDSGFQGWFGGCEACAQAMGVEGGDLEDAVAALGAAGAADEVWAGALDGRGECQVEDAEKRFGGRGF